MSGIVVGLDQAYDCTGISIWQGECLRQARAIYPYRKSKGHVKTEARIEVRNELRHVLPLVLERSENVKIICERIRIASHGFQSQAYIKSTAALIAVIVDTAYEFGIKVYSADTRSWKSRIVGTSKPQENKFGFAPVKWPTIKWCLDNGYGRFIMQQPTSKSQKGRINFGGELLWPNDNIADSIGIGKYGVLFSHDEKLCKLEQ